MADQSTANQLVSGFYPVERGQWRWTQKQFSVILGQPSGWSSKGGRLKLHVYVLSQQIEQLGPISLTAEVDHQSLAPETFDKEGEYTYTRDIQPFENGTKIVPIRFSLNKAASPAMTDGRELGIVVGSVALEPI